MDLEQVAAGAPKRSPTPESAHDAWKDGAVPNSGLLTPNPGISAASSEGAPLHFPGPGLETRFRLNGRPTPPRSRLGDSSDVGQPSASTVEPPLSLRFRSTTAETMHSQRATSTEASRSLNVSSQFSPSPDVDSNPSSKDTPTSQLTTTASTTAGHINNPSPFPSAGTLTTTFPSSFPYTNLSPSHFTKGTGSGARPSSGAGTRGGGDSDRAPPAIGPTMHTFDASLSHSTPSWTHQLQTTDDLVAYLEHRTRIAGQQ